MEENIRTQEEISLGDIFKILLKKIKVLILALQQPLFQVVREIIVSNSNPERRHLKRKVPDTWWLHSV